MELAGVIDGPRSPVISIIVRLLGQRVATYAGGVRIARASGHELSLRSVAEIGCKKANGGPSVCQPRTDPTRVREPGGGFWPLVWNSTVTRSRAVRIVTDSAVVPG